MSFLVKIAGKLPKPVALRLKKFYRSLKKKSGAYYCRALSGESNYNICVNSDMSVSCNCSDYDGKGHIGDLRRQSLQEIFDGDTAHHFRSQLASGKLPIDQCLSCPELTTVRKMQAQLKVHDYTLPHKGIMVENTVGCNLECLACDRNVVATRKRRIMSLEDISIVARMIHDCSIEQVCYHNLGEPFLSKRIHDELRILRELNPETEIVLSTNGALLDNQDKRKAALYLDHLYFSIDGASQASTQIYQVGGEFDKAIENMSEMVAFRDALQSPRPLIEWKYVVFEWNDSKKEIETAIRIAKETKVDIISFWHGGMPPGSPGVSSRFKTEEYFQNLGEENWKGRQLVLRPGRVDSLRPSA